MAAWATRLDMSCVGWEASGDVQWTSDHDDERDDGDGPGDRARR
jgi:hypothetical protein